MLRRRVSGSRRRLSSPSIVMVPELGSMRRLIIRIVVVLPQPDGPTNTVVPPAGNSSDTRSTAGTS